MKYRNLLLVISLLLPGMALISCDNQSQVEVDLPQKAISGLDSILPAGAKLENVTKGYEFDTAGSPQYADGDLYFTNNIFDPPEKSWTIKMDKAGEFHVLRKDNGVTTTIQHSGKGTFYCCEMLGHRVIEMDRD
ncbi:MAG: hypothetical protein HOC71_07110, partial [Candidatus Latescibacteria bacterium]|nr:hypothetical protein [Candidatus Latescibacterota bacterium]